MAKAAITGLAVLALAACQPVPPVTGPNTGAVPTTAAPTPTTAVPTTAAPTPTTVPVPAGWTLVGGDEFGDSSLDQGRWRAYHNTYGDGNNELACLTPDNVQEGGGALTITARRERITCPGAPTDQYSSGFVSSRESGTYFPRYARFEIRAKLPHAQGLWPAFWLRHRSGAGVAEVDIMEYFHSQVPGKTTQTLHLDGRSNLSKKTAAFEPAGTTQPGFHVWAVEIAPEGSAVRFTFSVDGAVTHTYLDTQHHWTSADPAATWDVAVNLAVGGKWTGNPDGTLGYLQDIGRCAQSGAAPAGCSTAGINRVDWSDQADSSFVVDYIRVLTR